MSAFDYTTTPPGTADVTTSRTPTGAAPAHTTPPAVSGTAPDHTTLAALSNTAPAHTTPAAPSATAPDALATAAITGTAPGSTTVPGLSGAAPDSTTPPELTDTPAVELPFDRSTNSLPPMPASFTPAFINLSGGGPTLKTLNASGVDATAGRIVTGIVAGEIKNYQVRAGTDDEALPGIVHPANYDAINNAVVFVSC